MSSMQEDIQCAGSDTRPPMLDRTDFESWQQRIHLYCLGKDNGENIMKSIKEGPFHMGTVSDVIAGGTEGAVQQRPVCARVLNDLSAEEKERYKADIRATNMLLQGNLSYTMNLNTSVKSKEKPFKDTKSNMSNIKYLTQSSKSLQPSNEPSPADNFQLDSGSSSTENLIESLSNLLALLTQSYKSHLPQTNNQLRTSSNARNNATVQDGRVVVQDVHGRYNANNQGRPFQRNNVRGNVVARNAGGQNRDGNVNPGQAKPVMCYNCKGIGHVARECP
ncbi:retrovirus-related pol polyprotein from transposon TNT 1-94 [Tanacetum coccineum]